MNGDGFEVVEQRTYLEIDGELHESITFNIDESRSYGILDITDEISLQYDLIRGQWYADAIRPEGWVDLDEEEIERLVDELGLEDALDEILEERA